MSVLTDIFMLILNSTMVKNSEFEYKDPSCTKYYRVIAFGAMKEDTCQT